MPPQQFCNALDIIIPPIIGKIIAWCVIAHKHKCEYDRITAEYRTRTASFSPHVVNKFGGPSARARSSSSNLGFNIKASDNFSELSKSFRGFGVSIKSKWQDLRLVESSKPVATTKLFTEDILTTCPIKNSADSTHSATPNTTHADHLASAIFVLDDRAPRTYNFDKPPLAPEILFTRVPLTSSSRSPFLFGPNSTTTDNLNSYYRSVRTLEQVDQHAQSFKLSHRKQKTIAGLDSDYASPTIPINPSTIALIYPQLADRQTNALDLAIDQFTGTKPATKSPFSRLAMPEVLRQKSKPIAPKITVPTKSKATSHSAIKYWVPPQDYYCTDLYKNKIIRKPNT